MRTIIEVPQDQLRSLDGLCEREGISRAEGIRRAIADHLLRNPAPARQAAFGLWRGRGIDGLEYQASIRDEWNR
jgi:Ribbon-helix-helix protein, copG family